MRLEEKRQVVEVLLCVSGCPIASTLQVARDADVSMNLVVDAVAPTYRDGAALDFRYTDRQIEAAYRLIESSPTLRREWFGTH